MQRYLCQGPIIMKGEVDISGAKNAALPIIAASLMSSQPVTLKDLPQLDDVSNILKIISLMGAKISYDESGAFTLTSESLLTYQVDHELMAKIRASILVMGPLLARMGEVIISTPGGCAIGARPIDMHLKAFEQMGAKINQHDGCLHISAEQGLVGTDIVFDQVSVTGTENVMMAACMAKGITKIYNAAREPEIIDLALLLSKMGADIEGSGTDTITIKGVSSLSGAEHKIMPDRIEAGTFMIAAAMTRGRITLNNVIASHLTAVIEKLKKAGANIEVNQSLNQLTLDMAGKRPKAVDITTCAYPGFPTDLQAPWMALATVSEGMTTIHETIFEHRLSHAFELKKLGAMIAVMGEHAVVNGVDQLEAGCSVVVSDLRAGAAMWLASLVASGQCVIQKAEIISRGYEFFTEKVFQLTGQDIGATNEEILA